MIVNGLELFNAQPILNMEPTKVKLNGVSHGLGEAGYDIRLKQDIWFNWTKIRTHNGVQTEMCACVGDDVKAGRFTIASAMEEFTMPRNLVGIVHDKSTWARKGLSVFNTVIEPGWKGFLTLELVYHGQGDLHIPAGSGIAQVIFHRTACNAEYTGKYQHQATTPVEAIFA